MKSLYVIASSAFVLASFTVHSQDANLGFKTIGDRLNLVKFDDGLDQFEATTLAMAYYLRYEGKSGGIAKVYRKQEYWIAVAINREHRFPDIHIHAKTGQIFQKGNPTAKHPWPALYEHLDVYNEGATDITRKTGKN